MTFLPVTQTSAIRHACDPIARKIEMTRPRLYGPRKVRSRENVRRYGTACLRRDYARCVRARQSASMPDSVFWPSVAMVIAPADAFALVTMSAIGASGAGAGAGSGMNNLTTLIKRYYHSPPN